MKSCGFHMSVRRMDGMSGVAVSIITHGLLALISNSQYVRVIFRAKIVDSCDG
jgi:hypothetical protein